MSKIILSPEAYERKLERERMYRIKKKEIEKLAIETKKQELWDKYCSFKSKGLEDVFFSLHIKSHIENFIEL